MPNFSKIPVLLNPKLQKYQQKGLGSFSEDKKKPVVKVKEALKNLRVLTLPRRPGRYTVDTDDSDT